LGGAGSWLCPQRATAAGARPGARPCAGPPTAPPDRRTRGGGKKMLTHTVRPFPSLGQAVQGPPGPAPPPPDRRRGRRRALRARHPPRPRRHGGRVLQPRVRAPGRAPARVARRRARGGRRACAARDPGAARGVAHAHRGQGHARPGARAPAAGRLLCSGAQGGDCRPHNSALLPRPPPRRAHAARRPPGGRCPGSWLRQGPQAARARAQGARPDGRARRVGVRRAGGLPGRRGRHGVAGESGGAGAGGGGGRPGGRRARQRGVAVPDLPRRPGRARAARRGSGQGRGRLRVR